MTTSFGEGESKEDHKSDSRLEIAWSLGVLCVGFSGMKALSRDRYPLAFWSRRFAESLIRHSVPLP